MDLLQQLLVNNSRMAAASDLRAKVVTAADAPTLLGSGTFSLLDGKCPFHSPGNTCERPEKAAAPSFLKQYFLLKFE